MAGTIAFAGAPLVSRLRVDPRGVRGELPKLGRDVDAAALFDLGAYGDDGGKSRVLVVPLPAKGEALDAARRLVLVGSDVGEGHFRAVEGDDDGYWDGAPAFDPRAVFAELAGVRTALRERYKLANVRALYTFLFSTPVERPVGRFHVDRVPGAMLLEVNPAEPWGTALRVSLAAGLVQEFWDLVRSPANAGEEWFTFGLARAYARELLRRFGTLAPKEVADDLNATTVTLADGAAYVASERSAIAGDRWGFELARALEGKGGLLALVDALYADARAGKAKFEATELLARAAAKLGTAFPPPVDGKLPAFRAARWVCFDVVGEKRALYTFPFAWESSRAAGVVLGASASAPVRDGEKLLRVEVRGAAMKVVVTREGASAEIAMDGAKSEATLPKVVARTDVTEAACREAP